MFNPNKKAVVFTVEGGKGLFFNQSTGIIDADSKADIKLTAFAEGSILVKFPDKEIEPGVRIRVKKPDIPDYGILIFLAALGAGAIILAILFYSSILQNKLF